MADRVVITVEAAKLRDLIYTEEYTNKNGEVVRTQKVRFEIVPLKEPKTIFSAEKYDLVKTHFASKIQSKEEREAKAETVYLGEGIQAVWKNDAPVAPPVDNNTGSDDGELPF